MWPFREKYPDGVWRCMNPSCDFECLDAKEAMEHDGSARGHATVWRES